MSAGTLVGGAVGGAVGDSLELAASCAGAGAGGDDDDEEAGASLAAVGAGSLVALESDSAASVIFGSSTRDSVETGAAGVCFTSSSSGAFDSSVGAAALISLAPDRVSPAGASGIGAADSLGASGFGSLGAVVFEMGSGGTWAGAMDVCVTIALAAGDSLASLLLVSDMGANVTGADPVLLSTSGPLSTLELASWLGELAGCVSAGALEGTSDESGGGCELDGATVSLVGDSDDLPGVSLELALAGRSLASWGRSGGTGADVELA